MKSLKAFLAESTISTKNPLKPKQRESLISYINITIDPDTLKHLKQDLVRRGNSRYEGILLNTIEDFCKQNRIDFDSVLGWYSLQDLLNTDITEDFWHAPVTDDHLNELSQYIAANSNIPKDTLERAYLNGPFEKSPYFKKVDTLIRTWCKKNNVDYEDLLDWFSYADIISGDYTAPSA